MPLSPLSPRPRVVVLDVDGTMTDTLGLMIDVMIESLASRGLAAPPAQTIREALGISLQQTIRDLVPDLPDAEVDAVELFYRRRYAPAEEERGLRLFDGVVETLDALAAQGFVLTIATGKSRAGLVRVLAKLGLAARFAAYRTADMARPKPDPLMLRQVLDEVACAPGDAVMVGDSTFDIDMAHAAGVRSIAVTYGAHPRPLLASRRPTAFAEHFPALLDLVGG